MQTDLFAHSDSGAAPVGPAVVPAGVEALSMRIPPGVRLGTSSWTFPGWAGLVYDREASRATLAEHGLAAYARHPLFDAVGVDRTYYGPVSPGVLRSYVEAVPDTFRFLVKAPRDCSFPTLGPPSNPRAANPSFLDAEFATRSFVEPLRAGLGELLGPLVFQLPPLDLGALGGVGAFLERLHRFLLRLPSDPQYAVEIRNREALGAEYRAALAAAGATPCYTVHPTMPSIADQRSLLGGEVPSTLVVRWMLGHGLAHEAARDRYRLFNRLVAEDAATRSEVAGACLDAVRAGREAVVIVNNKAEGSSPLSVLRLAERLAGS